jgi:hypothetical protein
MWKRWLQDGRKPIRTTKSDEKEEDFNNVPSEEKRGFELPTAAVHAHENPSSSQECFCFHRIGLNGLVLLQHT